MILKHMIFSSKCSDNFEKKVQNQGEIFVLNKLIKVYRSQPHEVRSYVFDDKTYDVSLKWQYLRSHQVLEASCSCRYFFRGENCPHVWATLLAINHDLFPEQANSIEKIDIILGQLSHNQDSDNEPVFEQKKRERKLTNPVLRQLHSSIQKTRENKSFAILPEHTEQEIWYDIGLNEIHRDNKLKLTFMFREISGGAKNTKLKFFNYQDEKVKKLSSETDKATLMLLKRFNTFEGQTYWQRKQQRNKNAICEIPSELYDKILVDLSKQKRLCFIKDDIPFAIQYKNDDAFFSYEVKNIDESWDVSGNFIIGDKKIPLTETKPISGSGLIVHHESLYRVNYQGLEDLANFLHKHKKIQLEDNEENQAELSYFVGNSTGLEHVTDTGGLDILKKKIMPKITLELHIDQGPMGISIWGNLWAKYLDKKYLPLSEEVLGAKEDDTFLVRDMEFEYSTVSAMRKVKGLKISQTYDHFKLVLEASNFIEITKRLNELGVEILARDGKVVPPSVSQTKLKPNEDWFEIKSELVYKDKRLTLPSVLQKLKDKSMFISLGNGEIGILPEEWLKKQLHIAELSSKKDEKIMLHKGMALYLDNLFDPDELLRPKSFSTYIEKLKEFQKVRMPALPKTFKGKLRDYQLNGVKWLHFLEKMSLGGCLADDMGLGKTIQVLACLESRRTRYEDFSALVVAPRSLLFNWQTEIEKFTPEMRIAIYHGDPKERKTILENLSEYDLILTTYGTCRRDIDHLKEYSFNTLVLDESQAIKNENSQISKSICLLQAKFRIAMSGTPVENHFGELYSLFKFLNPNIFSKKIINSNFDNPEEKVTKKPTKGTFSINTSKNKRRSIN